MPDEDYTLEELLELDLEPYQDQIDKVRPSALLVDEQVDRAAVMHGFGCGACCGDKGGCLG